MADVKVVDSSAAAALLFGEPDGPVIAACLGASRLIAPALLDFELANVCVTKMRKHRALRDALFKAFALRRRLGVVEAAVDHDAVAQLAGASRLTGYDASYLWLAREADADLVTLDIRLARAAASLKVRCAP